MMTNIYHTQCVKSYESETKIDLTNEFIKEKVQLMYID